jgi:hypothetical protein
MVIFYPYLIISLMILDDIIKGKITVNLKSKKYNFLVKKE